MTIRDHPTRREAARGLPLVTGSATVTRGDPLDRSRSDAVERAVCRLLDDAGAEQFHRRSSRRTRRDRPGFCRSGS